MYHARNITGVRIIVATHIVMALGVADNETEARVKVNNSKMGHIDTDSFLSR
jgi:hypothetical protein